MQAFSVKKILSEKKSESIFLFYHTIIITQSKLIVKMLLGIRKIQRAFDGDKNFTKISLRIISLLYFTAKCSKSQPFL